MVMAHIGYGLHSAVVAYIVTACKGQAYIVTAYVVMAHMVMAYIVMSMWVDVGSP